MSQQPTIGRIVNYRQDRGDIVPAIISAIRSDSVDLTVFSGAIGNPARVQRFVEEGAGLGEWQWPARQPEPAIAITQEQLDAIPVAEASHPGPELIEPAAPQDLFTREQVDEIVRERLERQRVVVDNLREKVDRYAYALYRVTEGADPRPTGNFGYPVALEVGTVVRIARIGSDGPRGPNRANVCPLEHDVPSHSVALEHLEPLTRWEIADLVSDLTTQLVEAKFVGKHNLNEVEAAQTELEQLRSENKTLREAFNELSAAAEKSVKALRKHI